MPRELAYLWNTFIRLHNRRGSSGFGASTLRWTEIDAFVRMSGSRLAPWEIGTIEALDVIYINSTVEKKPPRIKEE